MFYFKHSVSHFILGLGSSRAENMLPQSGIVKANIIFPFVLCIYVDSSNEREALREEFSKCVWR